MSASIYFEAVRPGRAVGTSTPQGFLEAMREAFGDQREWVLAGVEDARVLRGMAAADKHNRRAFEQLREALDLNPEGIRVWAEY